MNPLSESLHGQKSSAYKASLIVISFFNNLVLNNQITSAFYALLVLLQLPFLLQLPIQILLNYIDVQEEDQSGLSNKSGSSYLVDNDLGYILQVRHLQSFSHIVNTLDGLLLLVLIFNGLLMIYFRKESQKQRAQTSFSFTIASFMIILHGTTLFPYILQMQVLAIRCFFQDSVCQVQTTHVSAAFSMVGILANYAILYLYTKIYAIPFPHYNIPWAAPSSRFQYILQVLFIVLAFEEAFQDLLLEMIEVYVLLIPFMIAQIVQTWLQITTRTAFQNIVELARLTRDLTPTIIVFTSLFLTSFQLQSDTSLVVLLSVVCILATPTIYMLKNYIFSQEIFIEVPKDERQACQILGTLHHYQFYHDPYFNIQLCTLFNNHVWKCKDPLCPCKSGSSSQEEMSNLVSIPDSSVFVEEDLDEPDDTVQVAREKLASQALRVYRHQMEKKERDKVIMLFTLRNFGKVVNSNHFKFFETFINVTYYKRRCHLSYFNLEKMQWQNMSLQEQLRYYYLKTLTVTKIKKMESESKVEMFDIEKIIKIESRMQQFEKSVEETTLLVERFWFGLSKPGYAIREVAEVGKNIVDHYMKLKEQYDALIELNQENCALVQLTMNFHDTVMHFEQEAIQGLTQLKNIQQKLKIIRQNQYSGVSRDSMGQVLSSFSNGQAAQCGRATMIYCNKNLCDFLGYSPSQLLGKDISLLVPKSFVAAHIQTIQRYFQEEHGRYLCSSFQRVWIKRRDGTVLTTQLAVQTCISFKKGLVLVSQFNPYAQVELQPNISYKHDEVSLVLANEENVLTDVSYVFQQHFLEGQPLYLNEQNYSLEDLFPGYLRFSDEELEAGVHLPINPLFFQDISQLLQNREGNFQKVLVYQRIVRHHEWPAIKELIIVNGKREGPRGKKLLGHLAAAAAEEEERMQVEQEETGGMGGNPFEGNSSESSISTSSNLVHNSKTIIDLKQIPQSLQSLRNVIILFFGIMICTCMALLGVSIFSSNEFNKDQSLVDQFTLLAANLANSRLVFRQLLFQCQDPRVHNSLFAYLQGKLEETQILIRSNDDYIKNQEGTFSNDLYELVNGQNLEIAEVDSFGVVNRKDTTYQIGLNQYLQKFQDFILMSEESLQEIYGNVTMIGIKPDMTQVEKNAYFITENGNGDIRDLTEYIMNSLVEDSISKGDDWRQIVLIISLCCIVITVLTSLVLIPFIFALENESSSVMKKWVFVSKEGLARILNDINGFQEMMAKEAKGVALKKEKEFVDSEQEQPSEEMKSEIGDMRFQKLFFQDEGKYPSNLDKQFQNIESVQAKALSQSIYSSEAQSKIHSNQNRAASILAQSLEQIQKAKEIDQKKQADTTSQDLSVNETQENEQNIDLAHEQIRGLFLIKKCYRVLLILSISCVIVAFYVGTFFLAVSIFESIAASFSQIKISNIQSLCLAESFAFYQEGVARNETIRINYNKTTVLQYIQEDCFQNELAYQSFFQETPKELESVIAGLAELRTDKACDLVFNETAVIADCKVFLNGIMSKGLKNSNKYLFHYITKKYVEFESIPGWKITKELIRDFSFLDDELEQYVEFLLRYLNEVQSYKNVLVIESINGYLKGRVNLIIIVFVIFALILLSGLIFTLVFVIEILRKKSIENKILVKILPFDEIMKVQALQNQREQLWLDKSERKERHKEKTHKKKNR